MKISVVIPTFNRAYTLARAIRSVIEQSYESFDLWIIDDGSTDNTEDVVSSFNDPRINYVKGPNKGVSAARNIGVKNCQGDWIAFLDSDDEWLPERLMEQVKFLKENPDIPLVHGEEIWIRKGKRVNPKHIHKKFGGHIFEKCLPLCLISPSASLIKRELLDEVGGWDEEFIVCEDYDLWLKITSLYPVGFIEEPILIKHGGHEDQLSMKYKAMDYWRLRALERILMIRDLSEEHESMVKAEILKKASILKQGYIKHQNLTHLPYVEGLIELFS